MQEEVDWNNYFDEIQLALALNILKSKPKSVSTYEYSKKIQEELLRSVSFHGQLNTGLLHSSLAKLGLAYIAYEHFSI